MSFNFELVSNWSKFLLTELLNLRLAWVSAPSKSSRLPSKQAAAAHITNALLSFATLYQSRSWAKLSLLTIRSFLATVSLDWAHFVIFWNSTVRDRNFSIRVSYTFLFGESFIHLAAAFNSSLHKFADYDGGFSPCWIIPYLDGITVPSLELGISCLVGPRPFSLSLSLP